MHSKKLHDIPSDRESDERTGDNKLGKKSEIWGKTSLAVMLHHLNCFSCSARHWFMCRD